MSTRRTGGLVWLTRIVIILAVPCPLLEIVARLIQGRIRIPQPSQGSILYIPLHVLFPVFASYCFLLWAFGKIVCAVLATLTIMVALQRGIDQRTRALTVAAGSLTCLLLLWWVNVVKHQW